MESLLAVNRYLRITWASGGFGLEDRFRVLEKLFDRKLATFETKFTGFEDRFNDKLNGVESRFKDKLGGVECRFNDGLGGAGHGLDCTLNRIEIRFENLEKWFRWIIAFGVSVVGASLGTMKETVENAAARTQSKILLAEKDARIGKQPEPCVAKTSTSEFRKLAMGFHRNLQTLNLPQPEAAFDMRFFHTNP
ncbi:hypothetical protein HOY80DRAFT_1034533 [Tuber brumale]|nr:hypothetical protein HOY80DRAFT_1034533 [Tuber brumale]